MTDAVMAQVVEHVLGKDEVTGSNPVSSSTKRELTFVSSLFVCPTIERDLRVEARTRVSGLRANCRITNRFGAN